MVARFLLGNSGSPRWYTGDGRTFESYLDHLGACGATSAEVVLHHGPFDERTARVHVIEPDWLETVHAYQRRGIDVQFHVSLDQRFATSRWWYDRDGLKTEYEPIFSLCGTILERQDAARLVIHGSADPGLSLRQNEEVTVGLLDWLGTRLDAISLHIFVGLELGAAKPGRETAAARSRMSVETIVDRVGTPEVGICWDLAHDRENGLHDPAWRTVPEEAFLTKIVHIHLHDLGADGLAHYPLVLGTVPFTEQFEAMQQIATVPSVTMEVRWRCAMQLGDPWEMLTRSYEHVRSVMSAVEGR